MRSLAIIRFLMQGNNYSGPADVLKCLTTFSFRLCLDNLEKLGRRRIACERQFNKITCQKCETRQLRSWEEEDGVDGSIHKRRDCHVHVSNEP